MLEATVPFEVRKVVEDVLEDLAVQGRGEGLALEQGGPETCPGG